ncbi:MAG TPA: response regulator [Pyrinomonadaceae bacterium]|nr:response regulator [Pyrinomonadaceae bacterium]
MFPNRSDVVPLNDGASARSVNSFRKPTILVAEDSVDSREMLCTLLTMKGYEVCEAGDGAVAVEVALRTVPDLIFVDLQIPKLDGLGVARKLRLYPKLQKTPIVILSGYDPAKYRQAAIDAGCNDYLVKPIDFDRLEKLLNTIVPPRHRAARA